MTSHFARWPPLPAKTQSGDSETCGGSMTSRPSKRIRRARIQLSVNCACMCVMQCSSVAVAAAREIG